MPFTSVQRRRRGYSSPRAERVSWDLSLARDWPVADRNAVEVVGYVTCLLAVLARLPVLAMRQATNGATGNQCPATRLASSGPRFAVTSMSLSLC